MESGKWAIHNNRIAEMIQQDLSNVKIAQLLLGTTESKDKNKDVNSLSIHIYRFRKRNTIANHTQAFEDFKTESDTKSNNYSSGKSFMPSAWSVELQRFYTIDEFCDVYGLDKTTVKSSKLITHNAANITYNIVFYTPEEETLIDIEKSLEDLVQKYISSVPALKEPLNTGNEEWFDRLVYTDAHCGMSVQGNGDPLYDGKWDKEEFMLRQKEMISHVLRFKKSNLLVIDDLGDFLDGLGGETTRRGHKLPQNMNDKEVFDLGVEFKITLVESLLEEYDTIICNNVTEDNHAGVFGYFVASAVKSILEAKYPGRVTVRNMKRFMEHYTIGSHTFVLSHGKDSESLKFGFKPNLDAVQAEKIDQYCKEHGLYNGNLIEFSKGDSHLGLYDDSSSNDFQYYNYPAFSPPSNWVKTNFKMTKSGFRFYNIEKNTTTKIAIPYIFK